MQSAQVPPGTETGIFYIPICNLPFETRWKPLKEWLCRDCEVDYVQIFTISTSGWIRVRGSYNFHRVCGRLKEGVFNGRRIMYDDRNMTSSVVLKEVHDPNASPVSAPLGPGQAGLASIDRHQNSSYSFGPFYGTPYDSVRAQAFHNLSPVNDGHHTAQQQETWYPDDVPSAGFFPSTSTTSSFGSSDKPKQVVATEHRRIIIRRIGHNISEDQIRELIKLSLERITPVASELQRIEIPRGSSNQTRGHAFATFRTPEIARSVAESLNGKTWNSRQLEARLTNEGLTEEQSNSGSQNATSRQSKVSDGAKRKRPTDKVRASGSSGFSIRPSSELSSSRLFQNQQTTGPIIADGTSRRSRSKSKERKPK
ncbi:uncharacterized protein CTRU02_213573 [Colletotrichum truncatum]|uniref:Uncharacterized protein n=1 Tax=Colletotrichum truncatum TaxID=5467 RepID=A0ACC3YG72_COLTU